MTERTSGWRAALSIPAVYRAAQRTIGSPNVRATLVDEYLRPAAGDAILDIGCGTADILDHLPAVTYFGHDPSSDYIAAASERYGDRGSFRVGGINDVPIDESAYDLVVAKGVLHHVDDELGRELFEEAFRALKPGGRVVTIDPVYDPGQARVARYLASRDRGQNVRTIDGYLALVSDGYVNVESTVRHDLLRVPYSHAVVIATR